MGPGSAKNIPARRAWLPAVFIFLGIALAGLAGCGQSCDKLDTEFGSYMQGGVQPADKDKVLQKCRKAAEKCPHLSSPFEVMGDLKAKENRSKEAVADYQKALVLAVSKDRIQDKITRIETVIDELERKTAAAEATAAEGAAAQEKEKKMKRITGIHISEYPGIDESTRLEWCRYYIDQKMESLEERRKKSKSQRPFVLPPPALLDDELIKAAKLGANCLVYDVAGIYLENNKVQKKE